MARVTTYPEERQLHSNSNNNNSPKRCTLPPLVAAVSWAARGCNHDSFIQLAVAVKFMVLEMAPAASEKGMVSLKV
jgi:hypothetical protein